MTKDTYVRIVRSVLAADPSIRIHDSHLAKLNALGRQVESGARSAHETVSDLCALFSPFVDRALEKMLEKALR